MSESDTEQKIGKDNLARMERMGIAFFQNDPQNEAMYTFIGVSSRGTPVWLHKEVAKRDLKITIGQAQSNHWGAGGGGKLILPGVTSDETVESNHCAFVPSPQTHYGAYRGPMRSDIDEVATMCGLQCTMNALLDTRGRVIDIIFGKHPEAHRAAIEKFNSIYAYEHPGEQADIAICGVFAPTDHLFFHTGWGCMSADFVLKDGGEIIYCSPSPGVHTAIGDFPGLALMDLMKPYMPPTPENYQRVLRDIHTRTIQMWAGCIWVPIYEVMTRKRLTMVTLEENLAMAADIGMEATTSLEGAFAAAMERKGPDAKVIVLPFARYQLPRNLIRMSADETPPVGAVARGVIRGSTTIVEILRSFPDGEAAELMRRLYWPCAHCGGALARAADDGGRAPPQSSARRARGVPRARARRARATSTSPPRGSRSRAPGASAERAAVAPRDRALAAAAARALRRRDGGRDARRHAPAPARLPAGVLVPGVDVRRGSARAERLDDGVALPRHGRATGTCASASAWPRAPSGRTPSRASGSPDTRGFFALDFHSMDAWYEEEERIYVHARDPYLRADARRSSRHVVVEVGGVRVAETRRPVLLDETGLITRYYVPLADVRREAARAQSQTFTECPYKGRCEYWSVRAPGRRALRRRGVVLPLAAGGCRRRSPGTSVSGRSATTPCCASTANCCRDRWALPGAMASRRCRPGARGT